MALDGDSLRVAMLAVELPTGLAMLPKLTRWVVSRRDYRNKEESVFVGAGGSAGTASLAYVGSKIGVALLGTAMAGTILLPATVLLGVGIGVTAVHSMKRKPKDGDTPP